MSEPLRLKISRKGNEIGTFSPEEVVSLHAKGTLEDTDFYWHTGMSDWARLSQFLLAEVRRRQDEKERSEEAKRAERLARERAKAKEDEARSAEAARINRSLERARSDDGSGDKKDDVQGWPTVGALTFIIGGFVLVNGLASNPDGSAIRQQVLAQHMTNGILLMILGFVMARR